VKNSLHIPTADHAKFIASLPDPPISREDRAIVFETTSEAVRAEIAKGEYEDFHLMERVWRTLDQLAFVDIEVESWMHRRVKNLAQDLLQVSNLNRWFENLPPEDHASTMLDVLEMFARHERMGIGHYK
jgi:hypothetical protein